MPLDAVQKLLYKISTLLSGKDWVCARGWLDAPNGRKMTPKKLNTWLFWFIQTNEFFIVEILRWHDGPGMKMNEMWANIVQWKLHPIIDWTLSALLNELSVNISKLCRSLSYLPCSPSKLCSRTRFIQFIHNFFFHWKLSDLRSTHIFSMDNENFCLNMWLLFKLLNWKQCIV